MEGRLKVEAVDRGSENLQARAIHFANQELHQVCVGVGGVGVMGLEQPFETDHLLQNSHGIEWWRVRGYPLASTGRRQGHADILRNAIERCREFLDERLRAGVGLADRLLQVSGHPEYFMNSEVPCGSFQ